MIQTILKHWFTSADGETYALGRALGVFVGITLTPVPYVMLLLDKPFTLPELGIYATAIAGAITILITGTNPTEPKT